MFFDYYRNRCANFLHHIVVNNVGFYQLISTIHFLKSFAYMLFQVITSLIKHYNKIAFTA